MHFNPTPWLFVLVIGLSACDAPQKSPEAASISFMEKCELRLQKRRNVSPDNARQFCTCFLDEAKKKYSVVEIDRRMDGGATDVYKDSLIADAQACQSRLK